jgi:predicted small lipoprotein YifL
MRNIALMIVIIMALCACGLKGPLYMPPADSQPTAVAEPKPQTNIEQR